MEEKGGDGGRMEGSEAEDVKPTEDLMNDVNYYPVQEEHRPYIKVESLTKEYVAVLQTLQVICALLYIAAGRVENLVLLTRIF